MSSPPPSYPGRMTFQNELDPTEPIKLTTNSRERQRIDDLAELYVIIKATHHLEKSYIRDSISPEDYTDACQRLLSQFKTTESALQKSSLITNTAAFVKQYKMDCVLGVERLVNVGVPATVMHAHTDSSKDTHVIVSQATQLFITAMDALKLRQRAVDDLQPVLKELVAALNKISSVAKDFDPSPIQDWLVTLNQMRAVDELDEDQSRQLCLDLDNAHQNFFAALQAGQ